MTDDDEHDHIYATPIRVPRPKVSEPTMVGLGAQEARAERNTPSGGISRLTNEAIRELETYEALLRIAEELREHREELARAGVREERLDDISTRATAAAEACRQRLEEHRGTMQDVIERQLRRDDAQTKKLDELVQAFATLKESNERTQEAIRLEILPSLRSLDERVGFAPGTIDLSRTSTVYDLTEKQVVELEQKGTGLFRLFALLASADLRFAKAAAVKAGKSAGRSAGVVSSVLTTAATTAPAWGPPVLEALTRMFGH